MEGTGSGPHLPFLKGKKLSVMQMTSPRRNASVAWNKGGFLCKETQSVSETASLLLNDLRLHSLLETVPVLNLYLFY